MSVTTHPLRGREKIPWGVHTSGSVLSRITRPTDNGREVADIMDLRMKNVQKLLKEVNVCVSNNTTRFCCYFRKVVVRSINCANTSK